MTIEGVLPVLKPAGFTSHDVVAKLRKILKIKRIGHTGTLDPQVTGVLPLCIGKATRIVEYIQELPKEYEAELCIGYATDTEDFTGNVTDRVEHVSLTEEQIKSIILSFTGEIEQIPPMYSAVKFEGKRLYELAREGQEVTRQPRKVTIYNISIVHINLSEQYPKIKFRVTCSKGTYIRTLCVDIGRALGYPAVMSSLVRTSTGNITLDKCLTFDQIEAQFQEGTLSPAIIPVDQAIAHMPAYTIHATNVAKALNGRTLECSDLIPNDAHENQLIRIYSDDQNFIGVFMNENHRVTPIKIFHNR